MHAKQDDGGSGAVGGAGDAAAIMEGALGLEEAAMSDEDDAKPFDLAALKTRSDL